MTCQRQHVLLTGTSSGIGAATMAAAAEQGWHVFAGDRAEHPEVGDTDDNITRILRRSFDVDFFGQVALTQAMLPLVRQARGRIIFIGSIIDRITVPYFGALAAAKSAVAAVSDTFRQELAPWGIKVILVEPGFISTGADAATKAMIDKRIADMTPEQAELYGQMFQAATEAGYKTQTSGSSPDGVAEVIMTAFTDSHPHDHYLTGSKSHAAAFLARLPQSLQDEVKRKAFHQPKPGSM